MILLTGFYVDPAPARRSELLECLRRNALNETIAEVHLLADETVEQSESMGSLPYVVRSKLRVARHSGQLTFQHLFAYANAQLVGRRVIIANADIYFDTTLRRLQNQDLSGKLLCLSRWDVQADGGTCFFEHPGSQDAWIFDTPMRAFPCDFRLGVPACDNRLAWEAERAGVCISNPSRSVHANHLHLSGVRRYTERERLPGPTRHIPAEFLGTPWLWFVLSVAGGAPSLSDTVSSLATQACSNCIVVDGLGADGLNAWAAMHASASIARSPEASLRTASQRWNYGASAVEADGIICFVEGGTVAAKGLSDHVISRFEQDSFLVPENNGVERGDALICTKAAFTSIGGFDETVADPGQAFADLRETFLRARLKERSFPAVLLSCRADSEAPAQPLAQRSVAGREPLAAVAFHETMGCTVTRLTLGVSSHNNDFRPFDAVPSVLLGRAFMQAVACHVSPVELEFLQPGKVYVLVGTDWEGYYPVTAWLAGKGTKEELPPATTACGTGFEVWSLMGSAGQRFVIPTQVVLVGDRLVRA